MWEWTGDGGSHNVVAESSAFESDLHGTAGATFEYTSSESGVVRYACVPPKPMGMKGALVVGDVAASLRTEAEKEAQLPTFDGWLESVDNYEGVVDRREKSGVTIDVGAAGNGGSFAFSPAAVRVSPGTRVVWRWLDAPGSYDVVARDGAFRSEFVSDPGHEFAQTFGTERVVKYGCEAYAAIGMRGVVVVGDGSFGVELDDLDAGAVGTGLGLAALLSPLGFAAAIRLNGDGRRPTDGGREFRPENER